MSGKDVLALLPNGYGKSLVYYAVLAKFVFLHIKDKDERRCVDHAVVSISRLRTARRALLSI